MFDHYLGKILSSPTVNTHTLARGTPGCSGADLANMVNVAAVKAAVDGKSRVDHADMEYAKDKVMMGGERKSTIMSLEERKLTAFHEGGHALVASATPGAMPVHKATIIPRGQALGMVHQLPLDDMYSINRMQLLARMDVAMGGRVAEELIFGADRVTTGASSDMQQATKIATDMVLRYGMSSEQGLAFRSREDYAELSQDMKNKVDHEVKLILDASYQRAKGVLTKHRQELDNVANALLKYETLTGADLQVLLRGEPLSKPELEDPVVPERVVVEIVVGGPKKRGSNMLPVPTRV